MHGLVHGYEKPGFMYKNLSRGTVESCVGSAVGVELDKWRYRFPRGTVEGVGIHSSMAKGWHQFPRDTVEGFVGNAKGVTVPPAMMEVVTSVKCTRTHCV